MNREQFENIIDGFATIHDMARELALKNPPHISDYSKNTFSIEDIAFEPNSSYVEIKWCRYIGCGDYEYEATAIQLEEIFQSLQTLE